MPYDNEFVLRIVLLVVLEGSRRLHESLLLARYQAHLRMAPLGIIGGIKDARQRYRRGRIDRANDVQGRCSSDRPSASIGRSERVGHVSTNGAVARLLGPRLDGLIPSRLDIS